jgi:ABC-type uncharacterized transport system substrate-binding protein
MRGRLLSTSAALWLAASALWTTPAAAPPHRNDWVFDEMYSAFAVQGLEKNGQLATKDQLAPLAKTNVESLAEYDYFTYGKAGGKQLVFAKPIDYWLEERADKRVVLHFTLPLAQPTGTGRAMSIQIYDPTYFVDFELAAKDPVQLAGAPPGCSDTVLGANPLIVADGQKVAKSFDYGGTPSAEFALTMAGRVIVACP